MPSADIAVVIPWRGFRCFTPWKKRADQAERITQVVIPWRGFRCFTRSFDGDSDQEHLIFEGL